jgi:hypothetical protein
MIPTYYRQAAGISSGCIVYGFLNLVRTVYKFVSSLNYYMCMHDTWRPEIAAVFQLFIGSDVSAVGPLVMISITPPITDWNGHK